MNGSATTLNGGAVNGSNGSLNGLTTAAPRTATLGTPNNYAYTSTGSLLGRGASARPVPPPTLPKYSGSFSAGSSAGLRDRERDGTGGSHRLASLERLALRQRIIEQSANNQIVTGSTQSVTLSNGAVVTATLTDSSITSMTTTTVSPFRCLAYPRPSLVPQRAPLTYALPALRTPEGGVSFWAESNPLCIF